MSFPDDHASGDIAIADSYILNKNNTINAQNFFMLVGHGILHLFDYSHYDRQSRTNMRFLENMLMDLLGLKKFMKIKKNIALKLIQDLIKDEKFKKDLIDLISANSDSSGIAKNEEKKIFNNLLKVHKQTVDDVMVPRGEIIYIDQKIDKENLIKIINKEAHSRMPVVKGDLENCLGMVHIKDIFKKINNKSPNIKSLFTRSNLHPFSNACF